MKIFIQKYKSMSNTVKASIWSFVALVIRRGINVISTPIFTRVLTTSEYAEYNLFVTWRDILLIFSSFQVFNYATNNALTEFEDTDSFITSAQTFVTMMSAIVCILFLGIDSLFGGITGFSTEIILLIFVDIIFFSAFNLWSTKQRYEFRYKLTTILSILIGFTTPITGYFITTFCRNKGYGRIYGMVLVDLVIGLCIYVYHLTKSRNLFVAEYWNFIFKFGMPLIPHFLAGKILAGFDKIMINKMVSTSAAGIYSLAYSLSYLMLIVNDAILHSLIPYTYKCIKDDKKEDIKGISIITLLLVAGANLILILFAPEAVKIFAPEEYFEAIYIIPAVSASVFYMFLFNLFANIEYYYKETKYVGMASVFAAVMNVVLNYIFIPKYGYVAAGYTTLVSYILYAMGHYVFMRVVSKKHAGGYHFYDEKQMLAISIGFTAIALGIIPLYKTILIRYIAIFVLIIFAIVLFTRSQKVMKK